MVVATPFSFAFPKASECCVTYVSSCLVSQVCKYEKGLYLRGLQFNSGDVQKTKPTANFCASPWGSAHLQQLWQGLGKQPLSCNSCVEEWGYGKHSWARPKRRITDGSWCCSLCCSLSDLYLGPKNLHLDGKTRRDICIGNMVPPAQASNLSQQLSKLWSWAEGSATRKRSHCFLL